MTELPQGWAETSFGELFDYKGGSQPPKSTFKSEPAEGLIRLLQIRDFESDEKAVYIDDDPKWPRCSADDIMVGRYGASVGKILTGKEGAYNVALVRWIFDRDNLDRNWVERLLRSNIFQSPLAKISRSAQNGFNKADLSSISVSLPPLSEQRRITRKLDTLGSRTVAARTHLTAIAKLVERQKLAVLGHLFGKTGSDPKPTEHLWAIPNSWKWKKVKDIGEVGLGRQRSPENHQGPDMRPYIRSANITWSGVDTTDVKEMNFDDADFKRFELKVGDVLLNEGSGSAKEVGKPAIWRGEIPNCCFQNTVLRVQPRDCSSEYLYWYFLLTALSEGFVKDTKGVNIQHIGKGGLANFPIPVPPRDEQDEIVRRIKTALTEIDRIAAEAQKALKLTDRLDERILAKAFAGELVPQDPNDEPASVLLDRIREARANAPKKTRPRRTKATAMKKDPKDLLLADSAKWPANGVTSEELAKRVAMPRDDLRDALFELLGGTKPQLEQVFDKAEERMRLKRVAQ